MAKQINPTAIAVSIVLFATAIPFTGCSSTGSRKAQAEAMLEEKYGEDFAVLTTTSSGDGTYTAVCAPASDTGCLFEAKVKNDGEYMMDGYACKKVCQEIESKIADGLDSFCGNYSLEVEAGSWYVESDTTELTLAEFLKQNPENRFAIYIGATIPATPENTEAIFAAVQDALDAMEPISGSISLSFLGAAKEQELEQYMSTRARVDSGAISIMESGTIEERMIEDGKVQQTS